MNLQILVVEDNPADVELLRRAMCEAELDFELTVVDDGAEALALVRDGTRMARFVLAILDLNLPKHGGLEVLEAIRSSPFISKLPVIVLSSSSSPRERVRIEQLGTARQIVKPADLDEFMRIGAQVKAVLAEGKAHGKSAG